MVNGDLRRIQKKVIDLVKKTGCWDQEKNIGDAIENMALFCIKRKKEVKEWMENKTKNENR